MANTFDIHQLNIFIDEFVSTVPSIFRNNPITADLANQVDKLPEEFGTPFSLAVVGQMRMGKSSLINAMIGKELAAVGVNETTATINFFKYGKGELKDKFRVHWKDRHYEDFPCTAIEQWTGESDNASQTRFLEFFNDSEFFKKINVVDTPGTRSVINDHTEILNTFLAEKRERETHLHGGKADAILYVSGAVANVSTEDMLKEFQDNTRMPGASPYNSVAVLHKWETLNVEHPYEEALTKASFMEKQFQQYVAKVIPVSGPLALAAKTLNDTFWDDFVKLIKFSNPAQNIEKIIERGDNRFKKLIKNGDYILAQSRLPWACFRVIVKYAIQNNITEGKDLRYHTLKISGIENLMKFIEERFIERRNLIKSLTTLKKAIEPCHIAQLRIKNDIEEKERLLNSAEQNLSILDNYITKENEFLQPVRKFIHSAKIPFSMELELHKQTQTDLGLKIGVIEECYNQIMGDMRTLSLLDSHSASFSKNELNEIRHVCGSYGLSAKERTACYSNDTIQTLEDVEERIEFWSDHEISIESKLKPVTVHMISRLEELAEILENMCKNNE